MTVYVVPQDADWTWIFSIHVKAGDPCPMQVYFMWLANTILPMRRAEVTSDRSA
jgi:hypothetical protein